MLCPQREKEKLALDYNNNKRGKWVFVSPIKMTFCPCYCLLAILPVLTVREAYSRENERWAPLNLLARKKAKNIQEVASSETAPGLA